MNFHVPKPMSTSLIEIRNNDPAAKAILNWFDSRQKGSKETKVRVAAKRTGLDYTEVVDVFRKFEEIGAGRFIVGRHGFESRMQWEYDVKSLAKISTKQADTPERIAADAPDEDDDDDDTRETKEPSSLTHEFLLRPDFRISISLPTNFNSTEAKRLATWITSLPFDTAE